MSESLRPGLTRTQRIDSARERPMGLAGEDARIYSTPQLLYDMEVVCRELLVAHVDAGKDSVGTRIEIDRSGATPLGTAVEIAVTVTAVNNAAVSFEFVVRDDVEEIARGKHNRFVVDVAKTEQRLKAKLAKAGG
jgi:predicted thioesterase